MSIQWFFNGQQLPNEINDTLNTQAYGNGEYEVEVTDSLGCSKMSNLITYENLRVDSFDLNNLEISPNPFSDYFNIETNAEVVDIQILDLNGRIIQTINKSKGKIDGSNLKPGYYLLKISEKKILKVIKI